MIISVVRAMKLNSPTTLNGHKGPIMQLMVPGLQAVPLDHIIYSYYSYYHKYSYVASLLGLLVVTYHKSSP